MEPLEWIFWMTVGAGIGTLWKDRRRVLPTAARTWVKANRATGEVVHPLQQQWRAAVQDAKKEQRADARENPNDTPKNAEHKARKGSQTRKKTAKARSTAARAASLAPR